VKYVVITHFHNDHTQGAEAYVHAWPAAEVIATEATRDSIVQRTRARLEREAVTLPLQIQKLKSDLARTSAASQKEQLEKNLDQAEAYLSESKLIHLVAPTLLVQGSLKLYRKSGPIEIFSYPKAHTDGDMVVYLPQEKLLITGDVIHSAQPITKDGYLPDWIEAIDSLEKLDFTTVIGGHGNVLHGKERFDLWKSYFNELLEETAHSYGAGESLDAARKRLVPVFSEKYGEKFPKRFSETVTSDVEKAYRFVSGATE